MNKLTRLNIMILIIIVGVSLAMALLALCPLPALAAPEGVASDSAAGTVAAQPATAPAHGQENSMDYWSMVFVFMLATFIGIGVVSRVSRLLHTPLMSITNAISAIAVVGSIIVTGSEHPLSIRILGAIALFASMTNIVSGFMITDRMLKMFKTEKRPQ